MSTSRWGMKWAADAGGEANSKADGGACFEIQADENGIKLVVEDKERSGKIYKVTERVKQTNERMQMPKFGKVLINDPAEEAMRVRQMEEDVNVEFARKTVTLTAKDKIEEKFFKRVDHLARALRQEESRLLEKWRDDIEEKDRALFDKIEEASQKDQREAHAKGLEEKQLLLAFKDVKDEWVEKQLESREEEFNEQCDERKARLTKQVIVNKIERARKRKKQHEAEVARRAAEDQREAEERERMQMPKFGKVLINDPAEEAIRVFTLFGDQVALLDSTLVHTARDVRDQIARKGGIPMEGSQLILKPSGRLLIDSDLLTHLPFGERVILLEWLLPGAPIVYKHKTDVGQKEEVDS